MARAVISSVMRPLMRYPASAARSAATLACPIAAAIVIVRAGVWGEMLVNRAFVPGKLLPKQLQTRDIPADLQNCEKASAPSAP